MGQVQVLQAGLLSTLQDGGRVGIRKLGFPSSGAMDMYAMKAANLALGNDPKEAIIESAMVGGKYEFDIDTYVTIAGATHKVLKNGREVDSRKVISIKSGDVLELGPALQGVFSYLAIQGGFQVPEWLQSRSTLLSVNQGGLDGNLLTKGDQIPYLPSQQIPNRIKELEYQLPNVQSITISKGPEWHMISEESQKAMLAPFTFGREISRMGYRLEGMQLKSFIKEIPSSAVFPGTIQLPPNGVPIVLMKDAQTTGGYPRVAQVAKEDISALAQVKPGQWISFKFDRE